MPPDEQKRLIENRAASFQKVPKCLQ